MRTDRYVELGLWTDERIGDLIDRQAARFPDRELFLFEGRRITYAEFSAWVACAGAAMVTAGVRRGDVVLVQLPNCLEALVMQAAAFRIGAVNAPIVPIYREHETAQIIADARPAVIVVAAALGTRRPGIEIDAALATTGVTPRVKYLVGGVEPGWAVVPRPSAESADLPRLPEPRGADEPALMLYTSGTTSAPKGALLSSRALLAHLRNMASVMGLDDSTVLLAATPLSHLGGFVAGLVLPAFLGARSVILPGWNATAAFDAIATERVTVMMGATIFLQELIDGYAAGRADEHRLAVYMCAGSTIPARLIRDAQAVGVHATRNYGMTETAGICTAATPADPLDQRAEWDGRLLPGMEIQAVDGLREPLPDGEIGELRIRGPQLFDGYTDVEVTSRQIDADGWFYPGDVGRVAGGWVQMTGRSKDIINRGGEKLSTQDIEAALLSHPDIARAAVAPVSDERFGEAVGAWVVLRDGASWAGAEAYLRHLDELKLARVKFPVEWHVVETIPSTASGKVQKFRLTEVADIAAESGVRLDSGSAASAESVQ